MPDDIDQLIDRHGPIAVRDALAPIATAERRARILEVIEARLGSLAVAVEDAYDPHNAAATIRTSEALGLQDLHVIEVAHQFAAAKGVTRGSHKWIDLERWPSPEACAAGLRARGFRIFATAPDAAVSVEDVDIATPLVVMFGNEHHGLSDAARAACDGALAVPMFGMTESFNLSVTVGLAMSRLAARRRVYLSAPGDLDAARRARLEARWLALSVPSAVQILARLLGS